LRCELKGLLEVDYARSMFTSLANEEVVAFCLSISVSPDRLYTACRRSQSPPSAISSTISAVRLAGVKAWHSTVSLQGHRCAYPVGGCSNTIGQFLPASHAALSLGADLQGCTTTPYINCSGPWEQVSVAPALGKRRYLNTSGGLGQHINTSKQDTADLQCCELLETKLLILLGKSSTSLCLSPTSLCAICQLALETL